MARRVFSRAKLSQCICRQRSCSFLGVQRECKMAYRFLRHFLLWLLARDLRSPPYGPFQKAARISQYGSWLTPKQVIRGKKKKKAMQKLQGLLGPTSGSDSPSLRQNVLAQMSVLLAVRGHYYKGLNTRR